MADKSWMLPPNQRNKNRGTRRSSTDFMAANHRTQAAELQKTVQLLDDAYRASQRKQRREMVELRNFMRQVKTVAHVEMPSERRGRTVTKPLTKKGRHLARMKAKETREFEKRRAAEDARRPSFASIGAVYANGMSRQARSSSDMPEVEELEELEEIAETETITEPENTTSPDIDEISLKAVNMVNIVDEREESPMDFISQSSIGIHKPRIKSTPSSTVSAAADVNTDRRLVSRSKAVRQAESLSAPFGQSIRRSPRNKGLNEESLQLRSDSRHYLPPIQQAS